MGQRHAQACFPWSSTSIPTRVKGSSDSGLYRHPGRRTPICSSSSAGDQRHGGSSRRMVDKNQCNRAAPDLRSWHCNRRRGSRPVNAPGGLPVPRFLQSVRDGHVLHGHAAAGQPGRVRHRRDLRRRRSQHGGRLLGRRPTSISPPAIRRTSPRSSALVGCAVASGSPVTVPIGARFAITPSKDRFMPPPSSGSTIVRVRVHLTSIRGERSGE
jgi:hypothetical protein